MEPKLYPIQMLDNDETSFEDVIQMLKHVFVVDTSRARELANTIHSDGFAVCGEYMLEIAEAKIEEIETINNLNNINIEAHIIYDDEQQLIQNLKNHFQEKHDDDSDDLTE